MRIEAAPKTYRVDVVRSGDWWAITVPALPGVFSQAKRLDLIESMAREAIAMMLDVDESAVGDIHVVVTPPDSVVELLKRLEESTAVAREATAAVAETQRRVAELLHNEGLPMRDVGRLLGVSHQRVSQILAN